MAKLITHTEIYNLWYVHEFLYILYKCCLLLYLMLLLLLT